MRIQRRTALAGLACLACASRSIAADTADRLAESDVDRLLKEILPDPKSLWRSIPWKIALLDAQRSAATERKPIFIWAMDGHPLGCT